jgi:cytochrome c oxidase assembly protein subunit 15
MDILAAGFGTTAAMWAIGYLTHLPSLTVPGPVVLPLMLVAPFLGGVLVGRHAQRGVAGGAAVGLLAAVLNLLILGGVITSGAADSAVPPVVVWIPGSFLVSAVLAGVGAACGRLAPGRALGPDEWRSGFMLVTALTTLLVVIAGGLVTSMEAGLAVPDWPNSFETNMFLYPLARMTGGIYFEHAHRLYGSLVGLTTVVAAVVVVTTDRRGWLRALAFLAVFLVIAQGILGGLRVTGGFTLSTSADDLAPSRALAIVHGVLGQVFFALMTGLWAFTTRTWRDPSASLPAERVHAERTLTVVLLTLTLAQLALGAAFRHMSDAETPLPWPSMAHFTLAALVAGLAYLVGLRAWARFPDRPMLSRFGRALMVLVTLQLFLGVAALIPVMARRPDWRTAEVILATAHQANGALVLACVGQIFLWVRKRPTGSGEGIRRAGRGGRSELVDPR